MDSLCDDLPKMKISCAPVLRNENIIRAGKGTSLSAALLRAGGRGIHREITEVFHRMSNTKKCAEWLIARTKKRNEDMLNALDAVYTQVQQEAIIDVEFAAKLWEHCDDNQTRLVRKYDWPSYADGIQTDRIYREVKLEKSADVFPELKITNEKHSTTVDEGKRKHISNKLDAIQVDHPKKKKTKVEFNRRSIRRLTRSTKSLLLRDRADEYFADKFDNVVQNADFKVSKTVHLVPDEKARV